MADQLQGLKNFAVNIKATMLKIKNREKVSKPELDSVLQFYLETIDFLGNITAQTKNEEVKIGFTPSELELTIEALNYSIDHYDGEMSLGDMADIEARLSSIKIESEVQS